MEAEVFLDNGRYIPKNKWISEQRFFLCCMYRFFQKDRDTYARVFNRKFKDYLAMQGIPDGLSSKTIETQWSDMRRNGDFIWHEVHVNSPFSMNGIWSKIIRSIKQVAKILQIELAEKKHDDIDTSRFKLKKQRALTISSPLDFAPFLKCRTQDSEVTTPTTLITPGTDRNETLDDQEITDTPAMADSLAVINPQVINTPVVNDGLSTSPDFQTHGNEKLCNAGGKLCIFCVKDGVIEETESRTFEPELRATEPEMAADLQDPSTPGILYRWSNVDSQGINSTKMFLAGYFADTEAAFESAENFSKDQFEEFVLDHVHVQRKPSPFISTMTMPRAPIHRAIWTQEGAMISIIDTRQLTTQVFSAKQLIRKQGINIKGYEGRGEYLIWGKVPTPAIACTFKITTLTAIASQNPEIGARLQLDEFSKHKCVRGRLQRTLSNGPGQLDRASGYAIGQLLCSLQLPQHHSETVGREFAKAFEFKKEGSWKEYFSGVESAYATPVLITPESITIRSRRAVEATLHTSTTSHTPTASHTPTTLQTPMSMENQVADSLMEVAPMQIAPMQIKQNDPVKSDLDNDEEDSDDNSSIAETPCPVRHAEPEPTSVMDIAEDDDLESLDATQSQSSTTMVEDPQISFFQPEFQSWSGQFREELRNEQQSIIMLDDDEEEEEDEQDDESVSNASSEYVRIFTPGESYRRDRFAFDRERVQRVLNWQNNI